MQAASRGLRIVGATTMDSVAPTFLAMRPRETAKALGISPRLLWQLTRDNSIPHLRIGSGRRRVVLYSVAALQAWLDRESKIQTSETTEGGGQ
jgi:predicted DNA-binding transcriptional regulator AlpA